uniref:Uncharacterized protein n=1 Tax=Oryza meridionalis TaxID=40149 RepID=A0A0E0CBP7_9ORYZ
MAISATCYEMQTESMANRDTNPSCPQRSNLATAILTPDRQLWSGISVAVETANSVLCRHACVHHACTCSCIESFGCTIQCKRGRHVHVTMKTVGRRIQEAQYDQYCH